MKTAFSFIIVLMLLAAVGFVPAASSRILAFNVANFLDLDAKCGSDLNLPEETAGQIQSGDDELTQNNKIGIYKYFVEKFEVE